MEHIRHVDDCKRIQQILLDHEYEASLAECQKLWKRHSESWDAGWIILSDLPDKAIWELIEDVIEKQL